MHDLYRVTIPLLLYILYIIYQLFLAYLLPTLKRRGILFYTSSTTITVSYHIDSSKKSTEKDFYKHRFLLYTNYHSSKSVADYSVNVALTDWHVNRVITAKAQDPRKFPADFAREKRIRATRENRGRAAKYLSKKAKLLRYETSILYCLGGDEIRTAGFGKKAEKKEKDVICIRQCHASSSDEAVMDREAAERARKRTAEQATTRLVLNAVAVPGQHTVVAPAYGQDLEALLTEREQERGPVHDGELLGMGQDEYEYDDSGELNSPGLTDEQLFREGSLDADSRSNQGLMDQGLLNRGVNYKSYNPDVYSSHSGFSSPVAPPADMITPGHSTNRLLVASLLRHTQNSPAISPTTLLSALI